MLRSREAVAGLTADVASRLACGCSKAGAPRILCLALCPRRIANGQVRGGPWGQVVWTNLIHLRCETSLLTTADPSATLALWLEAASSPRPLKGEWRMPAVQSFLTVQPSGEGAGKAGADEDFAGTKETAMRDYRDARAMAKAMREALASVGRRSPTARHWKSSPVSSGCRTGTPLRRQLPALHADLAIRAQAALVGTCGRCQPRWQHVRPHDGHPQPSQRASGPGLSLHEAGTSGGGGPDGTSGQRSLQQPHSVHGAQAPLKHWSRVIWALHAALAIR